MLPALKARATLYTNIRDFFTARNVFPVETPLLRAHTVTDPHIDSIAATVGLQRPTTAYLQTSPEYAMKQLLVAGSGDIYQICKAFRNDERGTYHNPEFTMLEWYRLGFDHHALMAELDALVQMVLGAPKAVKQSYQACFLEHLSIDPFAVETATLQTLITQHNIYPDANALDRDTCLQLLLNDLIEPKLGIEQPYFLFDFPPTQAALAKIRQDTPPVAERFELYIQGMEIANGFHELTDATEQRARFAKDQATRKQLNKTIPEMDEKFLTALTQGLPDCAGVAVGLDRLLMIQQGEKHINAVSVAV